MEKYRRIAFEPATAPASVSQASPSTKKLSWEKTEKVRERVSEWLTENILTLSV